MRSSLNNIKLIADDGIFQEVMRYPEISAELVERLLHIKVDHVELQCYQQEALGKREIEREFEGNITHSHGY